MKDLKKVMRKILITLCFGAMQVFLSHILILDYICPIGLPFAMTRIMFGGNIFVVTAFYMISKIFLFNNLSILISTAYEVIIISLYYFTKEFLKTKKALVLVYLFLFISNALKLYFDLSSLERILYFCANLSLECLALYFFYTLFKTYQKKMLFCRFSHFDFFMILITVLLLSFGLFSYNIVLSIFSLLIIDFCMIFICKIFQFEKYMIVNLVLSFGAVLASSNPNFLLYSAICLIICYEFKDFNKLLYLLASILIMAVMTFVCKFDFVIGGVSILFATTIFAILPNRFILKLATIFSQDEINYIYKFSNENKIKLVQNKLMLMSNTLTAMQNNFKFLLVGKIDRMKACSELSVDVINNCCSNCEYYKSCFMGNINKKIMFEELIKKAIDLNGINSTDMTNGISSYCTRSLTVLSEINKIAKIYLSYESTMKSEDESKLVIANELQNFSNIFSNFSSMMDKFSVLNEKLSRMLKDGLLNSMVDVKEVAIFENAQGIKYVNIISTNEQILRKEMQDAIYRVIKNRVKLKEVKHIEYSGLSYATFLPIPKIKINFSVSTKSKENKNGDNAVIQKLDDNRFFVAIADGMGHGEKANKISAMVLSLIRSLFEVGFEEDLVIQSVNKLLLPAGLDNFTTLDACVIDLENEQCTFVKLGSSVSVLKHKNTSEIISCESLPIGMIQNIKPTITKKQISVGDMIFIASDGVVDSFSSVDAYKNFINDSKIYDMKKYLDDVICDADFQNKKHKDDMTIIGINLTKS